MHQGSVKSLIHERVKKEENWDPLRPPKNQMKWEIKYFSYGTKILPVMRGFIYTLRLCSICSYISSLHSFVFLNLNFLHSLNNILYRISKIKVISIYNTHNIVVVAYNAYEQIYMSSFMFYSITVRLVSGGLEAPSWELIMKRLNKIDVLTFKTTTYLC